MLKKWTKILPMFIIKYIVTKYNPCDIEWFISAERDYNPYVGNGYKTKAIRVYMYQIDNNTFLITKTKSELEKERDNLQDKLNRLNKNINKL